MLSVLICEDRWTSFYQNWAKESLVNDGDGVYLNGNEQQYKWFAQPSGRDETDVRFHFTDCSHILTKSCLRTKICTSGIKGLNKEAWIRAAKDDSTKLNIAIVVECIDKQSVAFARRIFGEIYE